MFISTELSSESTVSAKNNHYFSKLSETHLHSPIPPSLALNRSINETTCTTVTNIPCHQMKQKHAKENSSSKNRDRTVPTSFLPEPLPFQKNSSNLCDIFHSLSFPNLPSNIQDDVPTISEDHLMKSNTNNEQFQLLKNQFQTYLNDLQLNTLSRVIQLLSLCNHLNDEQIKDLLHSMGYLNLTVDDVNRFTTKERRIFVNEKFNQLRTTINDHKKVKD